MDVVSHALVGKVIQEAARIRSVKDRVVVISFAFLADIPGILFVYPLLGHEKGRPYWFPHDSDWVGMYAAHPLWAAIWQVPHSFFFLTFVVIPVVLWLKWPKIAIASYLSHILLDLPTHTGEWSEKPLYPLGLKVHGFTDAWAWPVSYWIISWVVLLAAAYLIRIALRKGTPPEQDAPNIVR